MNARTTQRLILTLLLMALTIKSADHSKPPHGDDPKDTIPERVFFQVTNIVNKIAQPADQKFHEILDTIDGATDKKPIVRVHVGEDGKMLSIQAMDDGKRLLFLGTMPQWYGLNWTDWWNNRLTNQYEQIRIQSKNNKKARILNINFNTPYELQKTGLCKTAQDDGAVTVHFYKTQDTYASSQDRLLEIIDKIKIRGKDVITYVNCKAGKGRSATGVAAYLFDLFERAELRDQHGKVIVKSDFEVSIIFEAINNFLKSKRSVVNINLKQRAVLIEVFEYIRTSKSTPLVTPDNTTVDNNNSIPLDIKTSNDDKEDLISARVFPKEVTEKNKAGIGSDDDKKPVQTFCFSPQTPTSYGVPENNQPTVTTNTKSTDHKPETEKKFTLFGWLKSFCNYQRLRSFFSWLW